MNWPRSNDEALRTPDLWVSVWVSVCLNHSSGDCVDGDALHLAIASYHRCDFLVTWNCKHLANANKFGHIRRINGILGLSVPSLVTPLELLGEDLSI